MNELPLNRTQQRELLAYLAQGRERAECMNRVLRQMKVWVTSDGTELQLDTLTPEQLVSIVFELIDQVDELKFNEDISTLFWPWPDFECTEGQIAEQLAKPAMDWLQEQPLVQRMLVLATQYQTPVPLDF